MPSRGRVFGATQTDDPVVLACVEEIRKRRARIGSYPELGLATTGAYARKLMELVTAAAAASPRAACDAAPSAMDALAAAQKALLPAPGVATNVARTPTADERARLDALARTAEDAIRACTAGLDTPLARSSLLRVTAEASYLSSTAEDPQDRDHAALLAAAPGVEASVDAADPGAPLVDRLFRADALLRADFLALAQDPALPIDTIRIYDLEEDADEAAVRVLRAIGEDPAAVGAFLLDVIVPADVRESCLADLAAGKTPIFGRFADAHPGACWRYDHAKELAQALDACGAR